jgi:preprotein translocase subunit SecA
VSLEDELVTRYAIVELLPELYRERRDPAEISDRRVSREIARAQEIIEAQHDTTRRTLRQYSALLERQRLVVRALREEALEEGAPNGFLARLDEFWSDHLAYADQTREGVHLQRLGHENPFLFFIRVVSDAFDEGLSRVLSEDLYVDDQSATPVDPASTWTYQTSDDPFPAFRLASAVNPAAAIVAAAVGTAQILAIPIRAVANAIRRIIQRLPPR